MSSQPSSGHQQSEAAAEGNQQSKAALEFFKQPVEVGLPDRLLFSIVSQVVHNAAYQLADRLYRSLRCSRSISFSRAAAVPKFKLFHLLSCYYNFWSADQFNYYTAVFQIIIKNCIVKKILDIFDQRLNTMIVKQCLNQNIRRATYWQC